MLYTEDWKEFAHEYLKAKEVNAKHQEMLDSLKYSIKTKYGKYDINIQFDSHFKIQLKVTVGEKYMFSTWFNNATELKNYLFDGGLTNDLYMKKKDTLTANIKNPNISKDELKEYLKNFEKELDELDNKIDIEIDEELLDKKLNRWLTYYGAMINRSQHRSNLRYKAEQQLRKEHKFKVGDCVLGSSVSKLTSGKPYIIKKIEKQGNENVYYVVPENNRGKEYWVRKNEIRLDYDYVSDAVNNPDKFKDDFDETEYNMKRYSPDNNVDEVDEALKILTDAGYIIVE